MTADRSPAAPAAGPWVIRGTHTEPVWRHTNKNRADGGIEALPRFEVERRLNEYAPLLAEVAALKEELHQRGIALGIHGDRARKAEAINADLLKALERWERHATTVRAVVNGEIGAHQDYAWGQQDEDRLNQTRAAIAKAHHAEESK